MKGPGLVKDRAPRERTGDEAMKGVRMREMRLLVAATLAALAACATVKAPTLQLEKLGSPHLGITGGELEVVFAVRNPNPDDLLIERFEYELELNGRRVGRG